VSREVVCKELAMTTNTRVDSRDSKAIDVQGPSKTVTDDFFAIAIFSGVGLLISLVAILCGQQGLWL